MRPFFRQPDLDLAKLMIQRFAGISTVALLFVLLNQPAIAQGNNQTLAGAERFGKSDVAVHAVMIPTGFKQDKYSAMIQIAVDGSPLPDATWDLEASFVSKDQTQDDLTGRVKVREPGTPVVLEIQVEFEPGPYELQLTARETTAGQSGARRLEGRWPDPNTDPATISPIVLLQPMRGAFVRGETRRSQGALARGKTDRIGTELPIALVSVVCRGPDLNGVMRIERSLEGAKQLELEPIQLPPGQDRCAQVRDLIEPGRLLEGYFKYEVRLLTEDGEIASRVREFDTFVGKF